MLLVFSLSFSITTWQSVSFNKKSLKRHDLNHPPRIGSNLVVKCDVLSTIRRDAKHHYGTLFYA